MLNELLVTAPSLETVSEALPASPIQPPMMTSWSPRVHRQEPCLTSDSLRGSLVQFPSRFHLRQLLCSSADVCPDEPNPPPQRRWPAWTWSSLSSGRGGSWHEVLLQGRNTSADCRQQTPLCSAPTPPVIRMATKMEIHT